MTGRDKLLEEALEAYKKANYNGVVIMPTGSGKGRLMIEIADILKPESILYLSNTTMLRDKMIVDEFHKWDKAYLLNRMDRYCYQSFYKKKGEYYDLLLADEFDAALTPLYVTSITNNSFKYKVLVSATLEANKRQIAAKIAPIIFNRTTTSLIKNKVLNSVKYTFIRYNLSSVENVTYLRYNERFSKLLNENRTQYTNFRLQQLQLERKRFLSNLSSSVDICKWLLGYIKGRTIIFCGACDQADKVCSNSYHSLNNNIEGFNDFANGRLNEIAVGNKIDRGVNISNVKNIVFENIDSSKTKFNQRLGRGMRLDVDDTLYAYVLVPYYYNKRRERRPTIVESWATSACEEIDIKESKTIDYEDFKL